VQRSDLSAIEEAEGYLRLLQEFEYTHEELSKVIGKSRAHVTNITRLVDLPPEVKELVNSRQITGGHARALLALRNPIPVARRIVEEGLTVRDIEAMAQTERGESDRSGNGAASKRRRTDKDPDTRALENALHGVLGLAVSIEHKGDGGEVRIRYKTLEQLDGLCRRLNPAA
jgi:ParB family chromosome partitioning protein